MAMSKKENVRAPRGSMLDKPGIALPESGPVSFFCFSMVVLSLAGAGAMGCFFTAFQIPVDPLPVFFAGAACALFCSTRFLLGRWKWLAVLVALAIWGIALWRNFDAAVQGCFRTLNLMLSAYGEKLNLNLPAIPTALAASAKAQKLVTLSAVFLQFPFYELLSWLFIRHKSALGAFGLTGIFLLLPMAISALPAAWALGLLLLFWVFLLFTAPSLRQRRQPADGKNRFQAVGDLFTQPAVLLLLPVLGLCIFAIYKAYPPETYERPAFVNHVRSELTEKVNLPAVFRGGTGSGGSRVDLSALGSRSYTGKTALRVKHEWQSDAYYFGNSLTTEKDYLKSFAGSIYTGTSWERLPQEELAPLDGIFGSRNAQTLPAELSQNMYSVLDAHFSYLLSVQKLDAGAGSIFSPYGLYSPGGAPEGMEYVDDGFLRSSQLFTGTKEYTLSAVAVPNPPDRRYINRFSEVFCVNENCDDLRITITPDGRLGTISAEGDTGQMQKMQEELERVEQDSAAAQDLWKAPEWAKERLPSETAAFAEAVEQYNDFVYEHYTQLPDGLRKFLDGYAAEHFGKGPVSVDQVRDLLQSRCSYTLSPPPLPEGEDFVEFFLQESREGYCVHFASAAVAILRYFGIPARYAEGYAVPVNQDGKWVNVPDYNAHAWAEVYYGGLGWVPVEVTPAGPMAPAAYANAATPGAEDLPSPTPSASPTPEPAESSSAPSFSPSPVPTAAPSPAGSTPTVAPSPDGVGAEEGAVGEENEPGPGLLSLRFLLIFLIIPVLIFLLWAQRKVRISYRERTFRQRDRNQAALRVYAHLLRLYEMRLALSDEGGPPAEIETLALKARFSNHTLTQEELQRLTGLAEELEKELEQGLPKLRRLRCKYLLALF